MNVTLSAVFDALMCFRSDCRCLCTWFVSLMLIESFLGSHQPFLVFALCKRYVSLLISGCPSRLCVIVLELHSLICSRVSPCAVLAFVVPTAVFFIYLIFRDVRLLWEVCALRHKSIVCFSPLRNSMICTVSASHCEVDTCCRV